MCQHIHINRTTAAWLRGGIEEGCSSNYSLGSPFLGDCAVGIGVTRSGAVAAGDGDELRQKATTDADVVIMVSLGPPGNETTAAAGENHTGSIHSCAG